MNNQMLTLTGTINPESRNMLTSRIKWAVQREGSEIVKNTILANMHDQGRALLTKTALDNLGALSAIEAQLVQIVPNGQERYRQIVDAYAIGAANKIWRW